MFKWNYELNKDRDILSAESNKKIILNNMKSMNQIITLAIIAGCLMAGVIFFQGALSVTDESIDMTGSAYEDTYDTTTTLAIQSISMINIVMLLVAIFAVIIAAKSLGGL